MTGDGVHTVDNFSINVILELHIRISLPPENKIYVQMCIHNEHWRKQVIYILQLRTI